MDRQTLFECLVAWINTFDLNTKCENVDDLRDGLVIAKCLNSIDPSYFTNDWISSIKIDTNDNWRLKLVNLKIISKKIIDYYSEILNNPISDFEISNLNLIETNNEVMNIDAINHLLQLVLGCAVNCERKNDFIQIIMEMSENTQHVIKIAIQDLMSKDKNMNIVKNSNSMSFDDDVNYQLKKSMNEINRLNELKDDIEQKCKCLDKQVSELQEEKMAMLSEIEKLKDKLQREDSFRNDPTNDHNMNLKLQQSIKTLQEDLYRLDSEKEKFKLLFEEAKNEKEMLMNRCIKYEQLAKEHQALKDEIDVLKHTSEKVEKLESSIETYKIKLEEMGDLKRQLRALEETNSENLGKVFQLEDEVKKVNPLKSQIEMYKKQIQELHEQILQGQMNQKKLEYEYKSVEEKYDLVLKEKERIQNEFDQIKQDYEQLNINAQVMEQSKIMDISHDQMMDGLFSSVELVNIPSEIKEKIIRLYHENKLLKNKQNDLIDERLILIQSQYEDEKQRTNDLQAKLSNIQKEKIELDCQLNDLRKKETDLLNQKQNTSQNDQLLKSKDDQINDLKSKLNQIQSQFDTEVRKSEGTIKKFEDIVKNLNAEKDEIKDQKDKEIQTKEKEINDLNEKYRVYLEKAKIVIKSLDPRNSNGNTEVQYLKNQLVEKEKQIKQLMKENERIRNSREQEEQLIASAWYKLGANLNRRTTDERISAVGNSFLSQQRSLASTSMNSNRRITGTQNVNQN
ncbi:unnamed protein product [Brachionus calyciflorus]|uniref:Calponin-homology (CH) domain-containing protein n=1 Tax=Brachionus calyciflorus TaxID=104777 RepID=A0A813U1Y5_9BILA|nr:unnamed protein product [Brachionus calyciflorus]